MKKQETPYCAQTFTLKFKAMLITFFATIVKWHSKLGANTGTVFPKRLTIV
jgi:hypothetical protein